MIGPFQQGAGGAPLDRRYQRQVDSDALRRGTTAGQSINSASLVEITLPNRDFGSIGLISGNGIKCFRRGVYVINAEIEWAANAVGYRSAYIYLNGTTVLAAHTAANAGAADPTAVNLSATWGLVPGDVVTLSGYQTSGGALVVQARTYLSVAQLSAT